jgi:hypothetical protein
MRSSDIGLWSDRRPEGATPEPESDALLVPTAEKVEQAAEPAVRVALACEQFYRQHQILGIGGRTVRRPPIGEKAHPEPGDRINTPTGDHLWQDVDTVTAGIDAQTIHLALAAEGCESGTPLCLVTSAGTMIRLRRLTTPSSRSDLPYGRSASMASISGRVRQHPQLPNGSVGDPALVEGQRHREERLLPRRRYATDDVDADSLHAPGARRQTPGV